MIVFIGGHLCPLLLFVLPATVVPFPAKVFLLCWSFNLVIFIPFPSLQPLPDFLLARQQVLVGLRQMRGQAVGGDAGGHAG